MDQIQPSSGEKAALELLFGVVEIVESNEPTGAPSGPMYAAFMASGLSLGQYQAMMQALVNTGLLTLSNNSYHITDKGRKWLGRV